MKISEEPVVVEETFSASIDTVWKAITVINQMRLWYFENIPDFKPEVGFETQFNVKSEERNFLHIWKVTEVIPGKKITYTWKFEEYEGDGFVTFDLFKQHDHTKLKLTNQVVEDFPDDIPEFTRESCLAGWTYFINQRLKDFLNNKK